MKRSQMRFLSWLLVLAVCVCLLPSVAVRADSGEILVEMLEDGFLLYTLTDGEASIEGYSPIRVGELTIPAVVGEGYPVTSIGEEAFAHSAVCTSMTIPDSVTRIGDRAFYYCQTLVSLVIPESVTYIGDNSFSYWSELDHILYTGDEAAWNSLSKGSGNDWLSNVTVHTGATGHEQQMTRRCTGYDYYCTLCGGSKFAMVPSFEHSLNESGQCMLCGEQMQKIYLDITGTGGASASCFSYNAPGSLGSYPGTTLTAQSDTLLWLWVPQNQSRLNFYVNDSEGCCLSIFSDERTDPEADLYICELRLWTRYNNCDHSFETVTVPPTCDQKGQSSYVCGLCGISAGTDIEPLGHQFVARALTEATCTEPGLMTSQCSVCGEVLDWQFPAIGHKYVHTLLEAPTCQSPAVVQHTCEVCGDSYTDDTVPPLDDDFDYGYLWCVDAVGQSPEYIVDCITMDWLWNHKCTEEDEYGCYRCVMTVPGDIFEEYLDRFAPLSMILEQVRGKYNVTYDAQAHTYTIRTSGGYGGFTNSRIYAGFVNNGSSYDVYYENVEKEWLTEEGYEYYYALAEELGYYPSSFEFDGKVYHDFGCGEYAHITSHTGTGNKYTVEWYEDQLRIVSMGKFAAGEMPTEFSYSQLWDPASTEHRYVDGKCQVCGRSEHGEAVQVSVTDFGDSEVPVRLELTQEGSTYVLESTGSAFTLEGVAPGSYTLKVSKPNHTTREYPLEVTAETAPLEVKLHLIGDITGDGRISVADVSKAYAQAKKTTPLTGYEFQVADVTGDGRISVADVSKLYAHAKKTTSLW